MARGESAPARLLRAADKAARRIDEAMAELRAGREAQPGKLIALSRLHGYENGDRRAGLRHFILEDAARCLAEGRSLALQHALPVEEKLALFRRVLDCDAPGCAPGKRESEAQAIHQYLLARFPGSKRLHVHGTRWRQPDSDLLQLLNSCSRHADYSWPFALTAYCIDYAGCRWMLTPRSLPRLATLRDWLDRQFPLRDGVRTFAGLPPQELVAVYCPLAVARR